MVIYVPMAKREQKPVYINNDIFNGTFRRNYEGDYHCTRLQVKTMLRDQTERTMDMEVLDKVPMPDMDGIEATRYIVENNLGKVLILTTFDDDELVQKALKNGAKG